MFLVAQAACSRKPVSITSAKLHFNREKMNQLNARIVNWTIWLEWYHIRLAVSSSVYVCTRLFMYTRLVYVRTSKQGKRKRRSNNSEAGEMLKIKTKQHHTQWHTCTHEYGFLEVVFGFFTFQKKKFKWNNCSLANYRNLLRFRSPWPLLMHLETDKFLVINNAPSGRLAITFTFNSKKRQQKIAFHSFHSIPALPKFLNWTIPINRSKRETTTTNKLREK